MRKLRTAATPAALAALLLALPAAAQQQRATITVDAAKPGPKVSPLLYGIFFEEINHAGDGGIYAELVRNRAFEDRADAPDGWTLVADAGAAGTIALDTEKPLNPQSPRSLRLRAGKGGVGVANSGYWGVPAKAGAVYRYSLWARRAPDFAGGGLTVRLEDAGGRPISSEGRVTGLAEDWKRFEGTVTAKGTAGDARLVVRANAPGTVWLDVVSLFPRDTWKGRANGLRPDLARMVADLKPGFVRFPGGCFVEGDRLANAFRWKETIGDIASRPGHWNLWDYRSTDGLGYHEYLQWCEDLGAEPLFVINCGMSHQGNVPMDQLGPWVQDALDAIEYANGPVTSQWGGLRAKNGHPKPFNLKLLQIGNENGGPAYNERYARFYDAVKAKYPDVRIVANDWGGIPNSRPVELRDMHAYNTPEFFAARSRFFDTYDRKDPKVYYGEFAATRGVGLGNLKAAIGEAAFMTGMERNSDVVLMSSYAPLMVHTRDRKWNPDAIVFDNASAYGTPSYYVQKLFAEYRGSVVLPTAVTAPAPAAAAQQRGAVGVGTWRTQAEYDDLKVVAADGRMLYSEEFAGASLPEGWRTSRGDWKPQGGALRQGAADAEDVRAVVGDAGWGDVTYTLRARKVSGAEGFLVLFRVRDDGDWVWWNIGGWNNTRHALEKSTGGAKSELGPAVSGSVETGRWYDIKVEVRGERVRCYLDGKLIHDVLDRGPEPLSVVAGRAAKPGEIILKVVNFGAEVREADVALNGLAGRLAPEATAITLTSDKPEDENSFAAPTKVAPVSRAVKGIGERGFRYTFPPYSLTVLRLGTRP